MDTAPFGAGFSSVALVIAVSAMLWTNGGLDDPFNLVSVSFSLLAVAGAFVSMVLSERSARGALCRSFNLCSRRWWFFAAALVTFITLQAVNPSHRFSAVDAGLYAIGHIAWLPRSIDSTSTYNSLWLLVLHFCVYLSARAILSVHPQAAHWMALPLIANMVVLAFLQTIEYINYGDEAGRTAPLVNANNFAAIANLCIPPLLVQAALAFSRRKTIGIRSHWAFPMFACLPILIAGVVASSSRAGIAVGGLLLAATLFILIRKDRAARWHKPSRWISPALLFSVAIVLMFDITEQRTTESVSAFRLSRNDFSIRAAAYSTIVFRMFPDRPLFGFGAGTFEAAYPYYRNPKCVLHFRYAHSDWLQYLVELGVVGALLLAGLLYSSIRAFHVRVEASGYLIALAGAGIHALIDFPLHVPALTLMGCVWAALVSVKTPST